MFDYFAQHPMQGVKYIVMIILAIIVFFLYRSIKTGDGKIFGSQKAENLLKNEFKIIDENTFSPHRDDYRLIVGMCIRTQTQLEKEKYPNKAFLKLPDAKRYAMTLGYVFEDSQVVVSNFFRSNGEPLLSCGDEAFRNVIGGELAEIFGRGFNMFDESNENVSVLEADVERLDREFSEYMKENKEAVYKKCADYIRDNRQVFLSE